MADKCKHPLRFRAHRVTFAPGVESSYIDRNRRTGAPIRSVLVDVSQCISCGAWLSLGPSDETDPRVAIEIRAAELSAGWADHDYRPGVDRFDSCPDSRDELCVICEVRYLAHAVAKHDKDQP